MSKMLCFLCGKKIGFFRSLVDKQYCSAEHRKEARMASAQAVRDEEDTETWAVERSRARAERDNRKNPSAGQTASILAFLTVGGLLVAALLIPSPDGGSRPAFPTVSLDPSVSQGFFGQLGDSLSSMVRSSGPVTLEQNFDWTFGSSSTAGELTDWITVQASNIDDPRDWGGAGNKLASLRLWDRSSAMHNYQMDFQGSMEKNSLHWVVRAADGANFYATKLLMTRPAPQPNAAVMRYAMVGGEASEMLQLPFPGVLERDKPYRISVTVQDSVITTYLDGQRISRFNDNQLADGGVGFFDDPNDPQSIDWVTVSERDSFLGRMLSHFSLVLTPHQPRR